MVIEVDTQDRVRKLLKEALPMLCRSGLTDAAEFSVEALIGITLKTDVFLVSIKETFKSETAERVEKEPNVTKPGSAESAGRKHQRKRRRSKGSARSDSGAENSTDEYEDSGIKREKTDIETEHSILLEDSNDGVTVKLEPGELNYGDTNSSHGYAFSQATPMSFSQATPTSLSLSCASMGSTQTFAGTCYDQLMHSATGVQPAISPSSTFYVCEFAGGRLSVVPKNWIFKDHGVLKCRWTASLTNVKSASVPNLNWKVHQIVKVHANATDNFEEADAYICDYASGISSAVDEADTFATVDPACTELPLKRKIKRKYQGSDTEWWQLETSSDDDDGPVRNSAGIDTTYIDSLSEEELEAPTPQYTNAGPTETNPGPTETNPGPTDTNPGPTETNPGPIETNADPIEMNAGPIETNADPIETNADPIETNADPIETNADPIETNTDITASYGISMKILEAMQVMEQKQHVAMNELGEMKAALVKRSNAEDARLLYDATQYTSVLQFELFCQKLKDDRSYRELFMNYLIAVHGSVNIGEVIRSCLRESITDGLMSKYNRTGRDGKKRLPTIFIRCIVECVHNFQSQQEIQVKKGKGIMHTTVETECLRQIEIFISNAKTRLKRRSDVQ